MIEYTLQAEEWAKEAGKIRVVVRLVKMGSQKLNFVKIIKDVSGMGLKDSKDWVDSFPASGAMALWVTDPIEFQKKMDQTDYHMIIEDKIKKRQEKLISLGLGDVEDKIAIISDHLTMRMIHLINDIETGRPRYTKCSEFFNELLSKLDEEQLDKLLLKNKE